MISVAHVLPDGSVKESFEMADGMTLEQAARTICPAVSYTHLTLPTKRIV